MRESNGNRKIDEEIAKRFLKGIAALPGIVIAKAHVFQDILILVERRSLEEAHAEQEVTGTIRREKFSVPALIGGIFLLVPFLWILEYPPQYDFEMEKL